MATDLEVIELVKQDADDRNVRYYPYLGENVAALYNVLRKRMAIGGDGTVTTRQLARDLYPDVGEDVDAWRRKRHSVVRWLRLLERVQLIRTELLTAGGGKTLGLRVELLAVNEDVVGPSRGCSSAG